MKLAEQDLNAFTALLASDAPAPGGGSAAALSGSVGAALTAMAAGLTRGRKKYAEFEEHAAGVQEKAEELRKKFLDVMDRDTDAFLLVSNAFSMPKETEEQKAARSAAIQEGLRACTRTPLEMMELCGEALKLSESMIGRFNETSASDLGVSVLALRAGMQGAWLNILINIGSLKDRAFADEARARGEALLGEALPRADRCYEALVRLIEG